MENNNNEMGEGGRDGPVIHDYFNHYFMIIIHDNEDEKVRW